MPDSDGPNVVLIESGVEYDHERLQNRTKLIEILTTEKARPSQLVEGASKKSVSLRLKVNSGSRSKAVLREAEVVVRVKLRNVNERELPRITLNHLPLLKDRHLLLGEAVEAEVHTLTPEVAKEVAVLRLYSFSELLPGYLSGRVRRLEAGHVKVSVDYGKVRIEKERLNGATDSIHEFVSALTVVEEEAQAYFQRLEKFIYPVGIFFSVLNFFFVFVFVVLGIRVGDIVLIRERRSNHSTVEVHWVIVVRSWNISRVAKRKAVDGEVPIEIIGSVNQVHLTLRVLHLFYKNNYKESLNNEEGKD